MLRLLEVNRVLKYEKRLRCTYSLYGRHPATAIFNPSIVANFTTLAGYNRQAPYRIISTQYDNNRVRDYNDDRKSGDMAAAKPAQLKTKRKRGRPKIRTDVTNVTSESTTRKIKPVNVFNRKILTQFVTSAIGSSLVQSSTEPPLVTVPPSLHNKFKIDDAFIENISKSLQEFLRINHKTSEPESTKSPAKDVSIKKKLTKKEIKSQQQTALYEEEKRLSLIESKTQEVKAFVNAAVNANVAECSAYVLSSRLKADKHKIDITDSSLYIDMLMKYAFEKQWKQIIHLLDNMKKAKVELTPQIYMIALDCLGRLPASESNSKLINTYLRMAEKAELSANDIVDKAIFVRDQREFVLTAIRRVQPDFHAVYTPPQLHYSNKLLDAHNADIQPIEKTAVEMMNDSIERDCFSSNHGIDAARFAKCIEEQFDAEKKMTITVKNITVSDSHINDEVLKYRAIVHDQLAQWKQDIKNIIEFKMEAMRQRMLRSLPKTSNPYPFMRLLPSEDYADILINELRRILENSDSFTATYAQLSTTLGQQVLRRYRMRLREQSGAAEKLRNNYKTYATVLSSGKCSDVPRQLWQRITHHTRADGPCVKSDIINWSKDTQTSVGRVLMDILSHDVKIDTNLLSQVKGRRSAHENVLFSVYRTRDMYARHEIRPHPLLKKIFDEAKNDVITFNSYEVPMVCYPVPWLSSKHGGYLSVESELMRLPFSSPMSLLDAVPEPQLYPSLDALNQLGCVPWRVNARILDLAIKVFNLGGDEDLVIPLTPDSKLTDEHLAYRQMTRAQLDERMQTSDLSYEREQCNLDSLYCDTLYKLSLANHYRDRAFWLPHNMDFRGRVYPIPPHLTHISADLTRSMLCFHQKQPLGEFGLDRLKLHCINLTGNKKRCSMDERLIYANEVLDDIIDSADNPLDGKRWWLNSDDPWQTLAACMEIADAIRSPDPVNFMSGFPVHQDGSCNGLQHYAALGRDTAGANSVNLSVSERPQDVYATVSERVEKKRQRDAMSSDDELSSIARALDGFIDRKVVKQTVMTSVYGVTAFGAALQIKKQLKNKEFSPDAMGTASKYVTKNTLAGLSEMFESATQIQDWLTEVAKAVAKDTHVQWTTPLGLPVIQPYSPDPRMRKSMKSKPAITNRAKQKTAFPPNFIHSLDSSHMMLTALNCDKRGLTFVSVHDCFWTHANEVPTMSRICREQFVLLHSQPILEDLAKGFLEQDIEFSDDNLETKLENTPKQGDFDLRNVLRSVYFFS